MLWSIYVGVFVLTLFIGARLMYTVVRVGVRTRARRAAHRTLIDLLDKLDRSDCDGALRARDVRMLAVEQPIAYCLPGLRQRVVLSEGVIARLSHDELEAVITHERAHLRARHDLVLEAFIAVHEAFPRFIRSRSALGAVQLLSRSSPTTTPSARPGPPRWAAHSWPAPTPSPPAARWPSAAPPRSHARPSPVPRLPSSVAVGGRLHRGRGILVLPTLAVAIPWLTELSRLLTA